MCRENEGSCVQQPVERQVCSFTHHLVVLLPFLAAMPSDRCCQGLPPGKNGMPCHRETIWAPTVGHPGRVTLAKAWQGWVAPCSCCWGCVPPPGSKAQHSLEHSFDRSDRQSMQAVRLSPVVVRYKRCRRDAWCQVYAVQVSPGLRGTAGFGCIAKCEGGGRGRG